MAHQILDRVSDTSATTGTGAITVANAPPSGFETLDTVLATGDTFDYLIVNTGVLTEWEVGVGTYSGSHVFARTTVKQSSNADAAVNFSAGTKEVSLVHSAFRVKTPVLIESVNGGPLAGFRNALHNGAMMVAQRGAGPFTSATGFVNNDAVFLLDRWRLLSDGNDIVDVSQSTTAPTGGLNSILLDVETADKKFGIWQVVEQKNAIGLIGNTCTLSFKAAVTGTSIAILKAAIVAWSSTADAPTADPISAWNANDTNPTLVANYTFENTPAGTTTGRFVPTTSFVTYSVSAAIDTASTTNVAVLIWCDDLTTTVGDFLYITDVQLEIGATATPFERRGITTEELVCQRYLPSVRSASTTDFLGVGFSSSANDTRLSFAFYTIPRIPPTGLLRSAATDFSVQSTGLSVASAVAFNSASRKVGRVEVPTASGVAAGDCVEVYMNSATAYLVFTGAEI